MKMHLENGFFLLTLVTALELVPGRLTSQTFTTLYSFTTPQPSYLIDTYGSPYTNSEGAYPGGLILSGSTLYGTAEGGGSGGEGTVFALNTDGTRFTTLYSFSILDPSTSPPSNNDGAQPQGLILSGNVLFGTTGWGGTGKGTVFAINTDGTGFSSLYQFASDGTDGSGPEAGVILSGGTLYGTTYEGGVPSFLGVVFGVNTDGTGYRNLHTFALDHEQKSELTLSGNTLYGTTSGGGIYFNGRGSGFGTVFKVNTDGTGYTELHKFTPTTTNSLGAYTNSEGAVPFPNGGVVLSDSTLYGTTSEGGSGGNGTVFAVNIDGTGFKTLHAFTASGFNFNTREYGGGASTNTDGSGAGGLILSGSTLYGVTGGGGPAGSGTIFKVNTDGTGFTTLYYFTALQTNSAAPLFYTNSDGASPRSLILSENILYGAADNGGTGGSGTIFSLSLPIARPQLTITPAGTNVILSWPTNAAGFTLQSTTDLVSPSWTTNLPAPLLVNGLNTVTNPARGTQQFYRLSQ
jgi:uncharacterized repeat protein (TIGR03803 family)